PDRLTRPVADESGQKREGGHGIYGRGRETGAVARAAARAAGSRRTVGRERSCYRPQAHEQEQRKSDAAPHDNLLGARPRESAKGREAHATSEPTAGAIGILLGESRGKEGSCAVLLGRNPEGDPGPGSRFPPPAGWSSVGAPRVAAVRGLAVE